VRAITDHGLAFPEGPRWQAERWWISDQLGGRVVRLDEEGGLETAATTGSPSGLGFTRDGTLLVATMSEPAIVAVDPTSGEATVRPDLTQHAGHLNDMFVDVAGRAYVDAYDDPFDTTTHRLLLVDPSGAVRIAADGLAFPNGVTTTVDGATLLISETFAGHVTAFDVDAEGALTNRRIWASLPDGRSPDGLCLDANGDVWVAAYTTGEFFHLREGGEVLDRIELAGRWALSCSLGGADGRSLLLCSATTTQEDYFAGRAVGHLDVHQVDVPGVGRP
jgi:sugar lactone lactonase YvrE